MKQIKIALLSLLGLFVLASCEKEEVYPISPEPDWVVELDEQYPVSMSAIVVLPENLAAHAAEGDQLAAFIGDECRGVGEVVEVNQRKLYFMLIKGDGSEQKKVRFQYYSSKNSYLYSTPNFLKFQVDTRFGSVDEPEVLPLEFVNP